MSNEKIDDDKKYEHVEDDVKIALLSLFQINTYDVDSSLNAVLKDKVLEVL
jgi:hypothetical protein